MRMHFLRGLVLLSAVGLAGCGSQEVTPDDPPPPPDAPPARLGDHTQINLADWLAKPRPELAQLVAEWTETVGNQRRDALENPLSLDLLPGLQPPGTMPVFGQAAYSDKAGFSLPPYLKAGDRDAAAALHLARLGDREAALRLADPADKDLLDRIDGRRTDHNYPLEWTQLTALAFQSAEWKLAAGQRQGATDIIQLHKQLRALLDGKAAAGPLGAALLPLGRRALAGAAEAWKKPKVNQPGLAEDADAALKDWGESPPPAPALAPGASQFEAVRLFGRAAVGQAVAAAEPAAVGRALDLLELPVPTEGASAVVAFFDDDRRLTETLVVYKPKAIETYPEPADLAHHLIDHGLAADDPAEGVGLTRQTYAGDGLTYESVVFHRGESLGAYVRIAGAKAAAPLTAAARDFGAVHLDRTFEANRLRAARDKKGPVVDLDSRKFPAVVRLPVADPVPDFGVLERDKDVNLTASLEATWPAADLPAALPKLIVPLLGAYGPAHIDGVAAADGDYLALVWEDARTRLTLRVPFDPNPVVFRAENRPAGAADARLRAAEAIEQAERKARLDAGQPLSWLPRTLQIPDIHLGMTRKQVTDNLPHKASVERQNLGGDLSLVFRDDPPPDATYWVRQMFLRFGADDRLAEIRVRCQEGPARPDEQHPSLLGKFKQAGGEPTTLPAPWAGLWPDLPAQEPKPALYRWADDVTVLTCQRDGGGDEAILHDRSAGQTVEQAEEALPPLRFCDEGAAGVALGQTRAEVLQKFPDHKPLDDDDGVAVAAPADSPYETLAVWFDAGKVVRVLAQHRAAPAKPAAVTAKMQEAWARDFDRLGALRRQDGPSGPVLLGYGWHDDRVRVRTLAQDTADGPRLFTEWRCWPATTKR